MSQESIQLPVDALAGAPSVVDGQAVDLEGALNGFRLKAVIDWVELEVRLPHDSQFRHVRKRVLETLGNVYVEPLDGQGSSRSFKLRVQDPGPPDQLLQQLQCMRRDGFPDIAEADIRVMAIEVALDAYVAGSDRQQLVRATHFLANRLAWLPSGVPRITRKVRYHAPISPRDLNGWLGEEASLNIGKQSDDHRARAYVKHYDTLISGDHPELTPGDENQPYGPASTTKSADSNRIELPLEQHRARIEITLAGDHLPFTTLEGWRNFNFRKLSKYFAMLMPTPGSAVLSRLQDRLVLLGRSPDSPKKRPSDRRKRPAGTRKDQKLNARIGEALRTLTRQMACRNLGTPGGPETRATEGDLLADACAPKCLNALEESHPSTGAADVRGLPSQSGLHDQAGSIGSVVTLDEIAVMEVDEVVKRSSRRCLPDSDRQSQVLDEVKTTIEVHTGSLSSLDHERISALKLPSCVHDLPDHGPKSGHSNEGNRSRCADRHLELPMNMNTDDTTTTFTIAELITRAQEGMGLDDKAFADALGYESPTVIEMIRTGRMRLPLNKAQALADLLEMEPRRVLSQLLTETSPDLLRTIEACMGPLVLTTAESRLVVKLRELGNGKPVTPLVLDGASVVAVVVTS